MNSLPLNFENRSGQKEPGYDYVRDIGSGGYGFVYLFSRTTDHRQEYVAGKFVYRDIFGPDADTSSSAAYQRAFEGLQNFRSLTTKSPFLLRIFDVRQRHDDGYFCYMMELADDVESGRNVDPVRYRPRTLKNELERSGRRQRLPGRRCIEIAMALAQGLQILHQAGFTHRDVRPSNIIFVDGTPKLADIDLVAEHEAALTSYIPRHYAAPEGLHSTQADLFSFGKTLYEMCTGLPVKSFPSLPADIRFWEDHQLVLAINRIISRSCSREPQKRFKSVEQLLENLEHATTTFS